MGFLHVSRYFLTSVELCIIICSECLVSAALLSMRTSGSILHFGRHIYLCALPCTSWL